MAMTPPKALSLSFHGGTGTGKTLVSKMIAESIFKRGMGSKYVHLISSTKDIAYKRTLIQYKVYFVSHGFIQTTKHILCVDIIILLFYDLLENYMHRNVLKITI